MSETIQLSSIVYAGVYFLLYREEIVYIGTSESVLGRIMEHVKLKKIEFDRVQIYKCDKDRMEVEKYYIAMHKPKYNRTHQKRTAHPAIKKNNYYKKNLIPQINNNSV